MLVAIIAAFTTLLQQGLPIILSAATASKEQEAQIAADLQAIVTTFQTTLANVQQTISNDDTTVDAEVKALETQTDQSAPQPATTPTTPGS